MLDMFDREIAFVEDSNSGVSKSDEDPLTPIQKDIMDALHNIKLLLQHYKVEVVNKVTKDTDLRECMAWFDDIDICLWNVILTAYSDAWQGISGLFHLQSRIEEALGFP